MAHAGGRPTKYKKEYIEMVDVYLESNQDEDVRVVRRKTKGRGYETVSTPFQVKLPTVEGFAAFIGVPRRSVFEWRDKYAEFSHSLEKILVEQQQRLINRGLSGQYNPTIAKLILSSNHNMREKKDVTSDDKPIGYILDDLEADDEPKNNG